MSDKGLVRSASTTIVGLGIVAALFMAIMSTFYLQHIPNQADLDRLETDLRNDFGLYLSATTPLEMTLLPPAEGSGRLGVEVVCTMRPTMSSLLDTFMAKPLETLVIPSRSGRLALLPMTKLNRRTS